MISKLAECDHYMQWVWDKDPSGNRVWKPEVECLHCGQHWKVHGQVIEFPDIDTGLVPLGKT